MAPPHRPAPPPAVVQLDERRPGPRPNTKPKGASGTLAVNGYVQTREVLAEWSGQARYRTADAMYRSDPTVRAAVLMVLLPIVEAEWTVSPASDQDVDAEAAELVRRALLEHLDWTQVQWDLARPGLVYGHGLLEEVYEAVRWSLVLGEGDDQRELPPRDYWVPRSYGPRLPHTVQRWNMGDEGELVSVEQLVPGPNGLAQHRVMGAENLVLFTNEREGDDPTGTSLLRSMYRSWYAKDKLEIIDAIRAERAGVGIPVFYLGEHDEDAEAMEKAGADLRANEQAVIVLKGSKGQEGAQEFEMADMRAASTADVQASLQYHVTQILWGVLGAWQALGHGEVGARATATVQDDPFYLLLRFFAGRLASVWQRQAIPRLVGFNFDTDRMPVLGVGELQGVDVTTMAEALAALITAGAIESDDDLEAHLRRIMGLPEKKADDPEEEEPEGEAPPAPPADDPEAGEGDVPPLPEADAPEPEQADRPVPVREHQRRGRPVREHGRRKPTRREREQAEQQSTGLRAVLGDLVRAQLPEALAHALGAPAQPEPAWWREPTLLEADHVLLRPIAGVIEQQRIEYERLATPAAERLATYLASNLALNDPTTDLAPVPDALATDLADQLHQVLQRVASFGRVSVRHELRSQRGTARSLWAEHTVDAAVHVLATKPPRDPAKLDAWLRKRADRSADAIMRRLQSAAEAVGMRGSAVVQQVASTRLSATAGQALRAQAVATVAQALAAGREAETREAAERGLIDHAEYSAILDANCCGPCRSLDGAEYQVGSEDYERDYPPLYDCDGADACRCMMVLVSAREVTSEV